MSGHADVVRRAYAMGWRVREDGAVISPRGTVRKAYVPPKKPYATVSLKLDGKSTHFFVHKLAAFCKFGERSLTLGIVVRHGKGGSLDNRWANLELGTQSENMLDRDPAERRAGALTAAKARRSLTDECVLELVAQAQAGVPRKELCERFGVLKGQLSEILSGKLKSPASRSGPAPAPTLLASTGGQLDPPRHPLRRLAARAHPRSPQPLHRNPRLTLPVAAG